jgi:P27 family predicted phage terminase small subunit
MGRHRTINTSTPTPTRGRPACPANVTGEARAEWDRVTEELDAMGALFTADRATLAMYCRAWARWVEAEAQVDRLGLLVASPKTHVPSHNPYISIGNIAADRVAKLANELGLTPRSRALLAKNTAAGTVTAEQPADDFADLD